jgi:hypothetical protein
MGKRRFACGVLVGKPEGRRQLGRAWHKREDNIKMYIQGMEWSMDWIDLAQDRN